MSTIKRTPTFQIRLAPQDLIKFDQSCRMEGKNRPAMARQFIIQCLDNQNKLATNDADSVLDKRLKKMEDRFAALMARIAIDVGMIFMLMYKLMNKSTRDESVAWAKTSSVDRLHKKLAGPEADVKELLKGIEEKRS